MIAEIEQGEAAFANLWGSSVGSVLEDRGASEGVVDNLALSSAPLVGEPGRPAATLWWVGFTIARHATEQDAQATFRALVSATGADVANAYPDAAVWLADEYRSVPTDQGVFDTDHAGAAPYPILPWMSLMNVALGTELVDFFQGKEDARTALADKARFGDSWQVSFLPPGYEALIEDCSVRHIDVGSSWYVDLDPEEYPAVPHNATKQIRPAALVTERPMAGDLRILRRFVGHIGL